MADLSKPFDYARNLPSESKTSILLVTSKPSDLPALREVLGDFSQILVVVHSAEEAVRQVQTEDFPVVLLDGRIPGVSRLELAKLIRGHDRSRHTPVIFFPTQMSTGQKWKKRTVSVRSIS